MHPKSYAAPSELYCTFVSYASELRCAVRATLHHLDKLCPTELRLTLNELCGCQGRISFHCTTEALIYNIPRLSPHPSHPCKLFGTLKNTMPPSPRLAHRSFALENKIKKNPSKKHSMGPRVTSQWTSEAKKYIVPCHHSCTDPPSDVNDLRRENPAKMPVWQKIRQSIPQLI